MPNQQFWPGTSTPYLGPIGSPNAGYLSPSLSGGSSAGTTIPTLPTTGVGGSTSVPTGAQQNALQQNLTTAPDLTSLTNLINQLNLQGQQAANAGRIPGEAGLEAQSSANIGQQLAGQVPQDVVNLLQQQGAERGVSRLGGVDNPNTNAAYLQALGLTSIGQQQAGQANLSSAAARNPVAKLFDPTSMLLTPYQSGMLGVDANRLALEWYKALHPNVPVGGGGGGGGQQPIGETQPVNSWWRNLMGGTPSSSGVTPPPSIGYPGGTTTATTPSGSSSTFSNTDWSQYFGDPYGTVLPNPAGSSGGDLFGGVGGVGYDQPSPFSGGYSAPSSGMGDLFGGLQGVGYDQTPTDPYSDPFNLYNFYGGG